jgi:hypothetical protein
MSTPTPRTDAAVKLTFAAGHNTVCPNFARTLERELTALTAERDQLRAEFEKLAITTAQAQERNVSHRLEREKAEAERTDAIYQRMCEVEQELRAEVKRMTHAYEYDHKCLYEVRDRCHLWKQRAQKAEADLAAANERLRSEAMDDYASIKDLQRELAAQRDKVLVLRGALENLCDEQNGAPLSTREKEWKQAMDRADAAMKEGAK